MHSRKANLTPQKIPWTLMESFFCVISFLAHAFRELHTIHSLLAVKTLAESLPMSSAQDKSDDDSWPYPRTFHLHSFPSCAQCALLSAVLCTGSAERSWCAPACIQHSSRNREQLGVLLVADMEELWEAVSLDIALAGGDRRKGALQ